MTTDKMREALEELFYLVKGECPSLLNEDSGGSAELCLEIEDLLAASAPSPQAQTEVALWQYRWTNPGGQERHPESMTAWRPVEPGTLQTVEDKVRELRSYTYQGCPCYEVRALYAQADEARDAAYWRLLVAQGRCDEKHGHGFALGDKLKAKVSFRYWCSPEALAELMAQQLKDTK